MEVKARDMLKTFVLLTQAHSETVSATRSIVASPPLISELIKNTALTLNLVRVNIIQEDAKRLGLIKTQKATGI